MEPTPVDDTEEDPFGLDFIAVATGEGGGGGVGVGGSRGGGGSSIKLIVNSYPGSIALRTFFASLYGIGERSFHHLLIPSLNRSTPCHTSHTLVRPSMLVYALLRFHCTGYERFEDVVVVLGGWEDRKPELRPVHALLAAGGPKGEGGGGGQWMDLAVVIGTRLSNVDLHGFAGE